MATRAKSAAKAAYPKAGGSAMTLTIGEGLTAINVAARMRPCVPSATGRLTQHTYCAEHTSTRVQSKTYCPDCDGECDKVGGYDAGEAEGGKENGIVVQIDKDEIGLESDKTLELKAVVEPEAVPLLYFEKSYMLSPDEGAESVFDQFEAALRVSGKWLVGTAVMRDATKAIVVRWEDETSCLLAHVCTYASRIQWGLLERIPQGRAMRPQISDEDAAALAGMLEQKLGNEFDLEAIEDEYAEQLKTAVLAAAQGVPMPEREAAEAPVQPVADLMSALKQGIEDAKASKPKPKPRKKVAA